MGMFCRDAYSMIDHANCPTSSPSNALLALITPDVGDSKKRRGGGTNATRRLLLPLREKISLLEPANNN
jgi:hypothetical protein